MLSRTAGYDAPSALVQVEADHALVMHLGLVLLQLDYKVPLELRWRQGRAAPVAWCEVALLTGRPALGNTELTPVGYVDLMSEVHSYAPGVVGNAQVAPLVDVPAGADLWAAVAVGPLDPSWLGGPLQLQGSAWVDPLLAGLCAAVLVPGWRPSQQLHVPVVTTAYPSPQPVALALSL